jgi:hypothetical protein
MTAVQLRSELKSLIDKTNDTRFLELVKGLFLKTEDDRAAIVEMTHMAMLSEEAIAKGEVYTREEVEAHLRAERRKREKE